MVRYAPINIRCEAAPACHPGLNPGSSVKYIIAQRFIYLKFNIHNNDFLVISINKITLQRGSKLLLKDSTMSLFAKQKVGLIGKNGSGKSSLFDLLIGNLTPEKGSVDIQNNLRIAHLKQAIPHSQKSAVRYVMEGNHDISTLWEQLQIAERDQQHEAVCQLHEKLFALNGYALQAEAGKILNGLGFKPEEHEKPVNDFSGGWKMRLNLAQTLISPSDIMLLDEPTNHLDLDAIIWLEKWLNDYPGALLVISHDRDFLDHVVNQIAHIEQQKLHLYGGNYSYFEEQRALKLEQQQAQFNNQQKKLKKVNRFIERFRYKATKAKQVQSRIKALERMDRVAEVHRDSEFHFSFKTPNKCGAPFIKMESVDLGYNEKIVLSHLEFQLDPGDRLGLLGHNGAGKSTFMKSIAGKLLPLRGKIFRHKNLAIGYFAQELLEQLQLDQSPLQHLEKLDTKATTAELRNFLGGFNFSGNMALSPIRHFSGGEKARLALAIVVWQAPNILILDEPTNHLDLEMREALNMALQHYEGALMLVSHDRHLLNTSVEQFMLIHNHHLTPFDGDVDDYAKWVLTEKNENTNASKMDMARPAPTRTKNNAKEIKKVENRLNKLYKEQTKIAQKLNDPQIYQPENNEKLQKLLTEHGTLKKEIETLEEKWLEQ